MSRSAFIYQTLKETVRLAKTTSIKELYAFVEKEFAKTALDLEYFTIAEETSLEEISTINFNRKNRAFIAVNAGSIRLIDNLAI